MMGGARRPPRVGGPYVAPSSSGLGRSPLKAEIAGSNPAGATSCICSRVRSVRRRGPHRRDRKARQAFAEAQGIRSAVEHEASAEPRAEAALEQADATKVVGPNRLGRLYLDGNHHARIVLQEA